MLETVADSLRNVVAIGFEAQFTLQAGEQAESIFWFYGMDT